MSEEGVKFYKIHETKSIKILFCNFYCFIHSVGIGNCRNCFGNSLSGKYIIDFSKWTYYFTYEMSNKEEYDKVFNGRYWWKNYLDELTFDAYDELAYVGIEQILEQDCYIFAFDGIVTDVGQVKLNLYVNKANNNVMKMEISIKYSGTRHCEDVTDATIQALYVQIGDEATSPRLPNPHWEVLDFPIPIGILQPISNPSCGLAA